MKYSAMIVGLSLVLLSSMVQSCESYNFSKPQPYDRENVYEFPASFQGKWAFNGNDEWVFVYKNRLRYSEQKFEERIAAGAWPRIDSNGERVHAPFYTSSLYEIRYDQKNKPIDTVPNFVLNNGWIFRITSDSLLENGRSYRMDHDTIIIKGNIDFWVDLGKNAFLRKLNERSYALNVYSTILGREDRWWQLFLFEKISNDSLAIYEFGEKSKTLPSMIYSRESNFYFNGLWTANELLQLKKEGCFIQRTVLFRANTTLRK